MMTFVNTKSEGLMILPGTAWQRTSRFFLERCARYLEPWFAAEEFPFSGSGERTEAKKKFLAKLMSAREKRAIGVYPLRVRRGARFTC